MVMVTVL